MDRFKLVTAVLLVSAALVVLPTDGTPAQAQVEQTVTWGEDFDMVTLDPRVSQSRHEAQAIMQIFESLVFLDTDGKLYPWLAESWQYSSDGTSITFKLRRGVRFHDGTTFDAHAVKFTFDSIQDPKLGSQGAIDFLGPYKSTEVLDPYTVRVSWTQPFAPALTNLSNPWVLSIVSPTAVQKLGNDGFARNPVGTGPFKFVEWIPRVRVALERFDAYNWAPQAFAHQGPVRIQRLVFRIIPDSSTRVAALEKGEIDVADAVPPIEVRRFKDNPNFDVMVGDVAGVPITYMFNTSRQPTNDLRVRQAFMYAVNRPRVTQQVFFDVAKPAFSPITPTTPGYWSGAEKLYPYDLNRAKELLEEAGWKVGADGIRVKNGRPLEMYFPVLLEPELAVPIQAAVKEAGINLRVETVTKAKQDELILTNAHEVLVVRWVAVDPSVLGILFFSHNIPAPGKFKFNWAHFGSPELDRMLRQAEGAVDPNRRSQILTSIQKFVLDRALVLPIHVSAQPIAYSKAIHGLKFAQGYWQVLFYDVTVTR